MSQVVDQATSGSVLGLALAVTLGLVALLMAIVWFFIRDRMRFVDLERHTLDKRLSAGAETMHRLDTKVVSVETQIANTVVSKDKCDAINERTSRQIDELKASHGEISRSLIKIDSEMKQGFKTMTNLLASVVKIDNQSDRGGTHDQICRSD